MNEAEDNASQDGHAPLRPEEHALSTPSSVRPVADENPHDPLEVLLQASAAAESLKQQFGELKQRRAELFAERDQLSADRSAFEDRAREFAEQVARDRTTQREVTAEIEDQRQKLRQLRRELDEQTQEISQERSRLESDRRRMQEGLQKELQLVQPPRSIRICWQ